MRPKTLFTNRTTHAALVLVTLVAACAGKSSSTSTGSPSPNCAALAVCCAAPSLPATELPTCTGGVKGNDDAVCQATLASLNALGYCHASGTSTSSGVGGSGNGGSAGSTTTSSGNGGGGGSTSTTASSSSSAGGPIIQSLSANPTPVTPTGTTVSALVSDSSGVTTLTGGTLTDKVSGTNYGAFSTPGGQGTFLYALTWSALYQAQAISFPAGGSEPRVVTAKFFDMDNRTASQDLTLTLSCGGSATEAPCSAAGCVDFSSDANNCGGCGVVCATKTVCSKGIECACRSGQCSVIYTPVGAADTNCTAACATIGATCAANTCAGFPTGAEGNSNNAIACSAASPDGCCCAE
jgi:hypothetical protein